MRWLGTRVSAQPCQARLADSHHLDETALDPWGLMLRRGHGRRTECRVVPSGPPRAGWVPLRRDEAPRGQSRPCLARAFQIFKVYLGTHDIVWPSNSQTQDVGMRGSIAKGMAVVHGKTRRAIFVGETPRLGTHSVESISCYFLITCTCQIRDCGRKRPNRKSWAVWAFLLSKRVRSPQPAPVARRQTPKTPVTNR